MTVPAPQVELASGRVWLRDEVEAWMRARGRQRDARSMESLTPAEVQVVTQAAKGAVSVPELAEALSISERTARNHLRNIATKLAALADDEG